MERCKLVDMSKNVPRHDLELTTEQVCIGRSITNTRVIEDISISRVHCVLEENNGEWYLWDKSLNGTRVNKHLLDKSKSYALKNGDVIALSGTIKFMFQKSGQNDQESNTEKNTLSDNEIMDIAESVIAEVEALDVDFYVNKFDDTIFGNLNQNSETSNPSQLIFDKNKQNVTLNNAKTGLNGTLVEVTPLDAVHAEVTNIIQQPIPEVYPQHSAVTVACVQSIEMPQVRPSKTEVKGVSAMLQPVENQKQLESNEPSCSKTVKNSKTEQNNLDSAEDELQCSICTEMFVKAVTLNCSHTFCKFCIGEWQKKQKYCPICRTKITSQFPTIVLDNFIEKILESTSDEVKEHRREMIKNRENNSAQHTRTAINPTSSSSSYSTASTSQSNTRHGGTGEPIEISSTDDDNSDMDYSDSDWEDDYENDDWYDDYNGVPGCYYGGYGHCYACGQRGHWANGCPTRQRRH